MPRHSLVAACLVLAAGTARARETPPRARVLSGSVRVGAAQSFLDLESQRECSTCGGSAVDYETEGVQLYKVSGGLGFRGAPLVQVEYERPFRRTESQSELLRLDGSGRTSYEKLAGGFATDPLAERYLKGAGARDRVLRSLLSVRYSFTREKFLGRARPTVDALFLPRSAVIDYDGSTISGGAPVSAGRALSFKTVYTDHEISFAVFKPDLSSLHIADGAFRLGWYWATWERLSDAAIGSLSASPIVYEASFKTRGIAVAFVPKDPAAPGLNVELGAKVGLDDRVDSAIDWGRLTGTDAEVRTRMIKFGAWYSHFADRKSRDGLSLTAGGSVDLRETRIENGASSGQGVPVAQNRDLIYKYFVSAGYRF